MTSDQQVAPPDQVALARDLTLRSDAQAVMQALPLRRRLRTRGLPWLAAAAFVALLVVSIGLRLRAPSPLWLDEAQSVAIARLPVPSLLAALREDGAPPLYYLLLHAWMGVFGTGDAAVRSLSVVCSVLTLPLTWLLGNRVGGRALGWATLLLTATNPFAVSLASETRMYSLITLLTAAGGCLLVSVQRRPRPALLLGLTMVSGLLLLTHYWAFFLLGPLGAALLVRSLQAGPRTADRLTSLALAAGGLFLLPWLPSLLYQLHHTGAPWASAPSVSDITGAVGVWADSRTPAGGALEVVLLLVAFLGFGAGMRRRRILALEVGGSAVGRRLAYLSFGPLVVAYVVGTALHGPFVARYTAIALVAFLLLAALGLTALPGSGRNAVVAAAAVLGLLSALAETGTARTQAGEVAGALERQAQPGDVVAYCPDQLGPSVSRLLAGRGLSQRVYPDGRAPGRVDWVDYASRNRAGSPPSFAAQLASAAGANSVWLVYSPGFHTLGRSCEALAAQLGALPRNRQVVVPRATKGRERMTLLRFSSPGRPRQP